MGQIVNVVERPSSRPGIVRFETNRALSGMGHDRFVSGQVIDDDRPVDELARRIFARGGVASIHVNGGMITVDLAKGHNADGIVDIIRGLYTFYLDPGEELGPDDPRAAVAARNEELQAAFQAAEAAAAAAAAEAEPAAAEAEAEPAAAEAEPAAAVAEPAAAEAEPAAAVAEPAAEAEPADEPEPAD